MLNARRFESYLAGSVMLLAGFLLVAFLLGIATASQLPSLFLVGVGVIFSILAVLKSRAPAKYEMSARTTLAYGVLAIVIGVLWFSLAVEPFLAGYFLAGALIFFGLIFLAYTRLRRPST